MDEEELHLRLSDAPTQTLARSEPKAQALEVRRVSLEPARRLVRLRMREDPVVPAHGV